MVQFNKERAVEVLIKPFKEKGEEILEKFNYMFYQKDLFKVVPESETLERKALLAFFAVLFDSQKESINHYKQVAKLYTFDKDFFTVDRILNLTSTEVKMFSKRQMHSMDKKAAYLTASYQKIKNEYGGLALNILSHDITETHDRLLEFPGYGDGLTGLLIETLMDNNIHRFSNEQDFQPKIDFHDFNIGIVSGIITKHNKFFPESEKAEYSKFLNQLAKEQDISVLDLDKFMWVAAQLCNQRRESVCEMLCPFNQKYLKPRAYTIGNHTSARAIKNQQYENRKKYQLNLFQNINLLK
ncbi:hypothetical protein HQ533_01875 [Candidatus Woesearchaeota archaeon]|nr:hypothetical protein [Candidatus Woesearchaeota archaeon]